MPRKANIVVVCENLLWTSRIAEAAKELGAIISFAKSEQELRSIATKKEPTLVVIDLDFATCKPIELLKALKTQKRFRGIPTLGFFAHVEEELKKKAINAGCRTVVSRADLAEDPIGLLRSTLKARSS